MNAKDKDYFVNMEEAVERYADRVYRVSMTIARNSDDAQDIFQEVFLRLVKNQKKICSEEHLKAWLIRVTSNCAKTFVTSAWNRNTQGMDDNEAITIDDSILDSTNNDNDMIENALLNLSDEAAGDTLVENESFVIDKSLGNYRAGGDELEYYRTTGRFYETDEISGQLASLLEKDGTAVLRTDYGINDDDFYTIAQQAADDSHKKINGFYWMGVIHLEE